MSYSHDSEDHRERVAHFAEKMRRDGIDAWIDRYVEHAPPTSWPQWMEDEIELATFILIVCTQNYYVRYRGKVPTDVGRGVAWEGAILRHELYNTKLRSDRFIPILTAGESESCIPDPLRGSTRYDPFDRRGYQSLLHRLFVIPTTRVLPLGSPPVFTDDSPSGGSNPPPPTVRPALPTSDVPAAVEVNKPAAKVSAPHLIRELCKWLSSGSGPSFGNSRALEKAEQLVRAGITADGVEGMKESYVWLYSSSGANLGASAAVEQSERFVMERRLSRGQIQLAGDLCRWLYSSPGPNLSSPSALHETEILMQLPISRQQFEALKTAYGWLYAPSGANLSSSSALSSAKRLVLEKSADVAQVALGGDICRWLYSSEGPSLSSSEALVWTERLLEIGCGVGQFELLKENFSWLHSWKGGNLSRRAALEKAVQYLREHGV